MYTITSSPFNLIFILFLVFAPLVWVCIKNYTGGVFLMLLEDLLKEFVFDCEIRKLSKRTIKIYINNNQRLLNFIKGNDIETTIISLFFMLQFIIVWAINIAIPINVKKVFSNLIKRSKFFILSFEVPPANKVVFLLLLM